MCNALFELGQLSAAHDNVQERLRKSFGLSNTDVDIALFEETKNTSEGMYFALRMEWNRIVIQQRWNPDWQRWEAHQVKVPKRRDLGLNPARYELPE